MVAVLSDLPHQKRFLWAFSIFCSIVSEYALWLQCYLIFHIIKDSIGILTFRSDNFLL